MSLVELKKELKQKKVVFGTEKTLKLLKEGKVKKVFLAINCPEKIKRVIKGYDVKIIELKEPNEEIALICKKPFPITVISC